mgnify:CR=1 FL=1
MLHSAVVMHGCARRRHDGQDRLTQAGFKVTLAEPWTVHIETDGNLLTGQNPASSESLARTLLDRLENVPQGSK